jgi:hypothetical protein
MWYFVARHKLPHFLFVYLKYKNMENGIVINGKEYELSEDFTRCGDCALYKTCLRFTENLCCKIFKENAYNKMFKIKESEETEMSAKDYIIVEGCLGTPYLSKKTKSNKLMSQDRRPISDNEIIGLFENYLKRFCIENKSSTLEITDGDGNKIFTAKIVGKMLKDVK